MTLSIQPLPAPYGATKTLLEILDNAPSQEEKLILNELTILLNKIKDSPKEPLVLKKIAETELALFEFDKQTESSLSLEQFVFYVLHQPELEENDIKAFHHIMAKNPKAIDWEMEIEQCFNTFNFSLTADEKQRRIWEFLGKIGPFSSSCELVKGLYKSTDKIGYIYENIHPHEINTAITSQEIEANELFRMLAYAVFFDLNHPSFDQIKIESLVFLIIRHTKTFPTHAPFFKMDDTFLSQIEDTLFLIPIYINYYRNLENSERKNLMLNHPFLQYWIGEEDTYYIFAKATAEFESTKMTERVGAYLRNYLNLISAIVSKLISKPSNYLLLTHLFYELFDLLEKNLQFILVNVLWGKNKIIPEAKLGEARLVLHILYSIHAIKPSLLLEDFILEILTDVELSILNQIHQAKRDKNIPGLLNLADKLVLDFENYRELKNHVGCSVATFMNIFALFKILNEIDVELCENLILIIELVFERLNLEKSNSQNQLLIDIRRIYVEYVEINLQALKRQLLSIPLNISIVELEHRNALLNKCQTKLHKHELPMPASMGEVSFLVSIFIIYLDPSLPLETKQAKIESSIANDKKLRRHFDLLSKEKNRQIDKNKSVKTFHIQSALDVLNERKHWNPQYINLLKQVLKHAFEELSDMEFEKKIMPIIQTIVGLDELTFSLDYVQTAFKQNRFNNEKKRELFLKEIAPYLVKKVNTISLDDQLALIKEQQDQLKQHSSLSTGEEKSLINASYLTLKMENIKSFETLDLGHESHVEKSDYSEFQDQLKNYMQAFSFTKYEKMMTYLFEVVQCLGFAYVEESSPNGDHLTYRLVYPLKKLKFGVTTIAKKKDMGPIYQMDCFKQALTYVLKVTRILKTKKIID